MSSSNLSSQSNNSAGTTTTTSTSSSHGLQILKAYTNRGPGRPDIILARGSVLDFTCCNGAIVNAANPGCLGGGGVDGAITAAGGPALARDRRALPLIVLASHSRSRTSNTTTTTNTTKVRRAAAPVAIQKKNNSNKDPQLPSAQSHRSPAVSEPFDAVAAAADADDATAETTDHNNNKTEPTPQGKDSNHDSPESVVEETDSGTVLKDSQAAVVSDETNAKNVVDKDCDQPNNNNSNVPSKASAAKDDDSDSMDTSNDFLYDDDDDEIRCRTGAAVITGPGNYGRLCVPYVIHAVGPNFWEWIGRERHAFTLLESAYTTSLDLAHQQHDITTVAFSLLSAGIYRGRQSMGRVLAHGIQAVAEWRPKKTTNRHHNDDAGSSSSMPDNNDDDERGGTACGTVSKVYFCAFTEKECSLLLKAGRFVLERQNNNNDRE